MAYMLGPSDFGLPSIVPPSVPPVGQSVVKALMAKHGVNVPSGSPTAPAAVAIPKPDLAAAAPVDIAGGNAPMSAGPNDAAALAALPGMKPPGFLDRIGGYLGSDEGKAQMLRFAMGAFKGGMGGGLEAATNFADERGKENARTAQDQAENAFRTRQLDDTNAYRLGQIDLQADENAETARWHRDQSANDVYRTDSENKRAVYHEGAETGRTGMVQAGEDRRTGAQIGEKQWEHITPSGDTTETQQGENRRTVFNNQNANMRTEMQYGPKINLHTHYTTTPEEFAKNGPRLRASQVQPADATVQQISSDAEYNSLASGSKFRGPDGQVRVKP
jgi:hypothetical protein